MRNPYTMNPVWGEKFYGRRELIEEILSGRNRQILIIGARRMGKTSLLRQVKYELDSTSDIGLYISLEAIREPENFMHWFEYALSEHETSGKISFDLNRIFEEAKDIQSVLRTLDKNLKKNRKRLFLLMDDAEPLVHWDLFFLQALRATFEEVTHIHPILTAAQGIYKLSETSSDWLTSPFLFWLERLRPLSDAEAEALIRQTQSGQPIDVSPETIAEIQLLTGNQPYLIQLLCSELFEKPGKLTSVSEEHLNDVYYQITPIIENSCSLLSPLQRQIVNEVSTAERISVDELKVPVATSFDKNILQSNLDELTALGYLKEEGGKYSISNYFFQRWLREEWMVQERFGNQYPYLFRPASSLQGMVQFSLVERQAFASPYTVGTPITNPAALYGYQKFLDDLLVYLDKNIIFLKGKRRIGKSSILASLKQYAPDNFMFISIQLQGYAGREKNLWSGLHQEICKEASRREIDVCDAQDSESYDELKEAMEQLSSKWISQKGQKARLVFLFDEAEVINNFSRETQVNLRTLLEKWYPKGVRAIFAGAFNKLGEISGNGSPLFNILMDVTVPPLDKKAMRKLIVEPAKGKIRYTRGAVNFIIEKADGYGYYAQAICNYAFVDSITKGKNKITKADVVRAYEQNLLSPHYTEFRTRWDSLPEELQTFLLKFMDSPNHKMTNHIHQLAEEYELLDNSGDIDLPQPFEDWIRRNIK